MEDILIKRREVFFNNLILLGLDKVSLEKKHGITFHRDMFIRPNKKGYEVVTYFLFSKLSSATGNDYNIPWPLVCKEHDRLFQKTCYNHLMSFSQENCVKFPRFVSSLLSSFGGDRFYEIYLAFSSYVLYKTVKKNNSTGLLSTPSFNQESFSTAKEILQLSTVLSMKKFKDTEMLSYSSYKIWFRFAKILEESLRKLKHLSKSFDELIKKKKSIIFTLYPAVSDGSFDLPKILEKIFESLKPVLKQRKLLDKFLSSEPEYWQHLCSEIGENAESEFLIGPDYKIHVTDYLPEKHLKELKDAGCLSSDENGKLSVEKFIKILISYVIFIADLLRKANMNELEKICSMENTSSIEDDLKYIKNLNKKLSEEMIPDAEKNIKNLKILTGYDDVEDDLELSSDLFCSLPNHSYGMKAVQQRTSHFDPSLEKTFNIISEKQLYNKNDDSVLQKYPLEHSFTSLTDQNFTNISSSFTSNIPAERAMDTDPNSLKEKDLNDYSIILAADSSPSPTNDISSLDDNLVFSYSSHFKMRESWLKEESLNSMTLPDVSFDE